MDTKPRYEEPFFWWGPGWTAPPSRSLADLLRDGTIDAWTAAVLWAALSRRRSLAVIASAGGAGKTTLLTALLDLLPAATRRVYLRGCFESFAFVGDEGLRPRQTALLINEISPHLPVYLWGPAVGRALTLVECGYTLLATAHAGSVPEFVGTLTGSPLRLPASNVAAFEFVALLELSAESISGRRVRGLWRLRPERGGATMEHAMPLHDISLEDHIQTTASPSPTSWFPDNVIGERWSILRQLRDSHCGGAPVLAAAPRV
jgi:hypothetical protein